MRVAVTGATGFVGGCVADVLSRHGHEVVALGRRPVSELRVPFANYVQWDVRSGPIVCARRRGRGSLRGARGTVGARARLSGGQRGGHAVPCSRRFAAPRASCTSARASVYATDQPRVNVPEDARVGEPFLTAYARTKAEAELRPRGLAAVPL